MLRPDHLMVEEITGLGGDLTLVLSQRYEKTGQGKNRLACALSSALDAPVYTFLQSASESQLLAYVDGVACRSLPRSHDR